MYYVFLKTKSYNKFYKAMNNIPMVVSVAIYILLSRTKALLLILLLLLIV